MRIVEFTSKRLRRRLAAGALLFATAAASGMASAKDACPLQTLYALTQASLLPTGDDVPLVAEACKVWPYDESLALAAVAYPLPESDDDGRVLRLVIAVLGAQEANILAVHETDLTEDAAFALIEDGLMLDTARYDLAKGVRAFGVKVRSSAPGPSCPDGRFNDELTLYVREGDALRPVFNSYTDFWARVEGEPCSWDQNQRLVTEEAAFTIGVERSAHNGFADLRVTANVARIESAATSDAEQTVRRRDSRIVRYDGTRYDTSALENGFFWTQAPEDK
ncbi:hypothetical protein LU699_17255 [Luteimonas fraxinea]|uniref:Uncharacterized protein n=1 Tax=Luteimonas fraxinea TaxID=2901869 RepID=A0ABS8UCL6_9GAMM|nr:hypothetical protein [Luteimonas fraxinea]MCD9096617.1 hypothetical protein [Luteimonas fraxinea]MCD9125951.1 hypothetical protein [Luteimonas fraxinea]UHH09979.1 hypothetical protein LU699_17255 [Luteimonas fraxinea]